MNPSPIAARIEGGGLNDDVHLGIGQGVPDGVGGRLFDERGRGADVDALAATDTDGVDHLFKMGRADDRIETAAVLAEVVYALDLGADANAPAAEDALLGVSDDRPAGGVRREFFSFSGEEAAADSHRIRQVLQFAVAVAFARLAVLRMVIEQEFDDIAAGTADFRRIRPDDHSVGDLYAARRHVKRNALHLDDADSAGAGKAQLGVVTQSRDIDPQLFGRFHDRRIGIDGDRRAVNSQGNLHIVHG